MDTREWQWVRRTHVRASIEVCGHSSSRQDDDEYEGLVCNPWLRLHQEHDMRCRVLDGGWRHSHMSDAWGHVPNTCWHDRQGTRTPGGTTICTTTCILSTPTQGFIHISIDNDPEGIWWDLQGHIRGSQVGTWTMNHDFVLFKDIGTGFSWDVNDTLKLTTIYAFKDFNKFWRSRTSQDIACLHTDQGGELTRSACKEIRDQTGLTLNVHKIYKAQIKPYCKAQHRKHRHHWDTPYPWQYPQQIVGMFRTRRNHETEQDTDGWGVCDAIPIDVPAPPRSYQAIPHML